VVGHVGATAARSATACHPHAELPIASFDDRITHAPPFPDAGNADSPKVRLLTAGSNSTGAVLWMSAKLQFEFLIRTAILFDAR
jgi:hypothetical protein